MWYIYNQVREYQPTSIMLIGKLVKTKHYQALITNRNNDSSSEIPNRFANLILED